MEEVTDQGGLGEQPSTLRGLPSPKLASHSLSAASTHQQASLLTAAASGHRVRRGLTSTRTSLGKRAWGCVVLPYTPTWKWCLPPH